MKLDQLKTTCRLCPHECELFIGEQGKCLIRRGSFDEIGSDASFEISTISLEPLGKKPILHFGNPEEKTLSLGGYGCNLNCSYCQNFKISQQKPSKIKSMISSEIIDLAKEKGVKTVCFTFNEPTLFYSQLIKLYHELTENNIDLVIKTNAYVTDRYWREICDHVDAMNIDYKGSGKRHIDMIGIKEGTYDVILDNILYAIDHGPHTEISIPVFEDYTDEDIDPLIDVLKRSISDVMMAPLHLLRVFPVNRLQGKPTKKDKLEELREKLSPYSDKIYIQNVYGK